MIKGMEQSKSRTAENWAKKCKDTTIQKRKKVTEKPKKRQLCHHFLFLLDTNLFLS